MSPELLDPLSRSECDDLLRQAQFGRVIYTDRALPACTPVNFAMDGLAVIFRTTPGSRLALATDHQVVAFEVDSIDPLTRTGWSVVVTGNATPVVATSDIIRMERLGLSTWAPGDRQHWVRLTPGLVSGRRLRAHDAAAALAAD